MARSNLSGRFYGELIVEFLDGNMWQMVQNEKLNPCFGLTVDGVGDFQPKDGFIFDFASLPAIVRWLYPKTGAGKTGKYGPGAVIHDWIYSYPGSVTREMADRIFLLGMEIENVRPSLRTLFYLAVRVGGARYFGKPDRLNKLRTK